MSSDMMKPIMSTMLPVDLDESRVQRISESAHEADKEKVCTGFESYFLLNLLKDLDKIAHVSKKQHPEQSYMSIAYEKVADFLAQRGGIGVKEMLMRYADRGTTKVLEKNGDNISK